MTHFITCIFYCFQLTCFFLKTELAGIDHPPKRAHSGYYFRQKIAIPQANEFCCVEPLYITASAY